MKSNVEKQSFLWSDEWMLETFPKVKLTHREWYNCIKRASFRDKTSKLIYDEYLKYLRAHPKNIGKTESQLVKEMTTMRFSSSWASFIGNSFLYVGKGKWNQIVDMKWKEAFGEVPAALIKYALIKHLSTTEKRIRHHITITKEFESMLDTKLINLRE